jgi:hypothetical protein
MPIHPPGERFRYSRLLRKKKGKRDVAAVLQLTAMVDMFTVLVVFLLQNYNVTGQVLYIQAGCCRDNFRQRNIAG